MEYLLIIYQDETSAKLATEADQKAMFKAYSDFTAGVVKSGKMRGGNALEPSSTATTVRVREGKTLTTDGPYTETKEQLGGYYLVDAKDLDDAIRLAAGIPGASFGSVEVRPVRPMPADYPRP